MVDLKRYKWPLIMMVIIITTLMIMIAIGFTVGVLSGDPDGLERVLIDGNGGGEQGESWIEDLPSVWNPFLSWIENEYVAGIIGIAISVVIIISIFYMIQYITKKKE